MTWSASRKNTAVTTTMTNTMAVVIAVSRRVGQVTFWASVRTSCKNLHGLIFAMIPAAAWSGVGRSPGEPLALQALSATRYIGRLQVNSAHSSLAGVEGLEPPTPGFGDRCSSH